MLAYGDAMDKAQQILDHLDRIPERQHAFAASLAEQMQTRGSLSEKQFYWFDQFYTQATSEQAPATNAPATGTAERFPQIVAMFKSAIEAASKDGEGIEQMRLRLETHDGLKIRLKRTESGRFVGDIYANERGTAIAERLGFDTSRGGTWFARISWDDGTLTPNNALINSPEFSSVLQLLRELNEDATAAMKVQGQRTSACGMCGRKLTNEVSRQYGIGPICRGKWGLGG